MSEELLRTVKWLTAGVLLNSAAIIIMATAWIVWRLS